MQIWESKYFDFDSGSADYKSSDKRTVGLKNSGEFAENGITKLLDVEVEPSQAGLKVMSIGKASPLCRLRPLGHCGSMQAFVESGDRIVAIDGIFARNLSDLAKLIGSPRHCEITIFDHRTRLTVSWQIHVRSALNVA